MHQEALNSEWHVTKQITSLGKVPEGKALPLRIDGLETGAPGIILKSLQRSHKNSVEFCKFCLPFSSVKRP